MRRTRSLHKVNLLHNLGQVLHALHLVVRIIHLVLDLKIEDTHCHLEDVYACQEEHDRYKSP